MRVLLISHTCQSQTEGQPKAELLGQYSDIDLCVLVPDRWKRYGQWRDAEPPRSDAFQYQRLPVRWPWFGPAQNYLHWYPKLGSLIEAFQPHIIDLWEEPWSLVSVQACRLQRRLAPDARIISETEQNIDKRLPPPFEQFRRYTLSRADHVVGRSSEAVDVVRQKGYRGPATVVPNAVDAALFRPMERSACREPLDIDGFVIGYVGRLVDAKGIADLIKALPLMQRSATLVLAGSGPDEQQFRVLAHQQGVADRTVFLGARPLDQLPAVMNACNVLVLPSRTTSSWKEQFGRVLIEAQACGVPVLGSASGGIPEVVGSAGVIVPERDPVALAGTLDRLAGSSDLCRQFGEAGLRQVEQRFTWSRVAEAMREIYLGLARSERPAGASDSPLSGVTVGG